MKITKKILYVFFATMAFLAYKNIISMNLFIYAYNYFFIIYMLYCVIKQNKKVNAKLFGGVAFSLLGLAYTIPYKIILLGITLFILAILTIINLTIYIKSYDANDEKNSYALVFLSMIMIVMCFLLIAMNIQSTFV